MIKIFPEQSSANACRGKFPVEIYTKHMKKPVFLKCSEYWDQKGKTIKSSTGELDWEYGDNAYFTVNTKGTKGVAGFAPNKNIDLDDWKIETENPFGVILIY